LLPNSPPRAIAVAIFSIRSCRTPERRLLARRLRLRFPLFFSLLAKRSAPRLSRLMMMPWPKHLLASAGTSALSSFFAPSRGDRRRASFRDIRRRRLAQALLPSRYVIFDHADRLGRRLGSTAHGGLPVRTHSQNAASAATRRSA
jgi:hypothetical protein